MKKLSIALGASLALTLAACGSTDDASTEAQADTVEIPANDALDGVDGEPVDDANAVEDATAEAEAAMQADTEAAADAAEDVAAKIEAAEAADGNE